jgi:hypothetical protein
MQLSENITSSRPVAYIHVSSEKGARWTHRLWGALFMYKLYKVGDKMEPCGTPAQLRLNFLFEINEQTTFMKVV